MLGFKTAFCAVLVLLASACSAFSGITLNTLNDKIAAAEISFQGAVSTVTRLNDSGVLTNAEAVKFTQALDEVDAGLQTVNKFRDIGDLPEAERNLVLTDALLRKVLDELSKAQGTVVSYQLNTRRLI